MIIESQDSMLCTATLVYSFFAFKVDEDRRSYGEGRLFSTGSEPHSTVSVISLDSCMP